MDFVGIGEGGGISFEMQSAVMIPGWVLSLWDSLK
jgi:hypothetical protein